MTKPTCKLFHSVHTSEIKINIICYNRNRATFRFMFIHGVTVVSHATHYLSMLPAGLKLKYSVFPSEGTLFPREQSFTNCLQLINSSYICILQNTQNSFEIQHIISRKLNKLIKNKLFSIEVRCLTCWFCCIV